MIDAAPAAPEAPGVLQARAVSLLEYPKGKSAMVLYAASPLGESLRGFLTGTGGMLLRRAEAAGARWIRFAETADPDATCGRLLSRFSERFGAAPVAND